MAPTTNMRAPQEVIDLVSDDNSNSGSPVMQPRRADDMLQLDDDDYMAWFSTPPASPRAAMLQEDPNEALPQNHQAQGGIYVDIDGEHIFIPDEIDELVRDGPASPPANANTLRDHEIAMGLQQPDNPFGNLQAGNAARDQNIEQDREVALALENQVVTSDTCLQRVLEIFPDINHEHVFKLYNDFGKEGDYETLPGQARLDNIIEQLVSASSYPKQDKGRLKRKREPSIDENDTKKWERQDRVPVPHYLNPQMRSMLKAEFPDIPKTYINDTLRTHQHFYQAYVALAKAKDSNTGAAWKGRASADRAEAGVIAMSSGWPELIEELNAARLKVHQQRAHRAAEEAKVQAEKRNLDNAIAAGETSECSACFDDLPMNRQIHCNGPVAHFTCFDCAFTYIKTEVGESRCRVLCTAGCGAAFANHQLHKLSDKQLLEKLSQLQQEKDIRDAGLDDLEECPFCDYKAILPPIDEDFEFRCANPECEKVSCRRCKSVSHIPVSCEQHAKDNKVNSRHKIEEAMTAALVRSCNQCKKQFIKDFGCNKMHCPSCNNTQCYVCSATLKDYNHFDQGPSGNAHRSKKCPLYDNVEERHEREVREAEAAARAQVVSQNPDVTVEDLEIKVSDAVKKATAVRIQQAGPAAAGIAPILGMGAHQDQLFVLEAQNLMARQQVAAADRVRQQAARRNALQAHRVRQEEIMRVQRAQMQAMRAQVNGMAQQNPLAQGAQPQGAQGLARAAGLYGPVQGYIPVLWNPPAAPPAPQAQQRPVPAPQQPQQQPPPPQAQSGLLGVRGRRYFDLDDINPFHNFGLDGAADYEQNQAQNQFPNNMQNNPGAFHNAPIPEPLPMFNQRGNDVEQQRHNSRLHNLRRLHQARLEQTEGEAAQRRMAHQNAEEMLRLQMNAPRPNPQPNHHYQGYEEEMRRMGFPQGR